MEDFEIVRPSNAFDVIAEAVKDIAEEATTGADFLAIDAGLNELEEMAGKLSERDVALDPTSLSVVMCCGSSAAGNCCSR
jgi:hypothetical protein